MTSNTVRDPRRWWILGALCLALLVLTIDNTVLNLAIPSLITDLHATPGEIQWILDAYVLAFAGLLLTAGSLSDRFGRRKFLIIGLVIFGAASVVATLASDPWQLIAARGLMGIGGSLVMPSTLSILMTVFDAEERRKAIAIWSVVAMLGVAAGPTLGGFLLDHFWWGSIFLLNIPIAVIAIVAAVTLMPETHGARRKVDLVGAVLSIVGLTSAVYCIIEREWNLAGIAVAIVALGAFIIWERKSANPMLPLQLFRDRNFTGSSLSILLMMFGAGALLLMLTQYFQFVLGYSPMAAGLALLPYMVASAVFNILGSTLGQKISSKTLVVVGFVIIAASFVILATTTGYGGVLAGLMVMGVGGGLVGPSAYALLMGAIPVEHAGVGSAMNDTVQQVGMALSIAILGSVLASVFTSSMPAGVPDAAKESIGAAFQAGFLEPAKDAFTNAMHVGAWVGAVSCAVAAVFALAVLRKQAPAVAAGEQAQVDETAGV